MGRRGDKSRRPSEQHPDTCASVAGALGYSSPHQQGIANLPILPPRERAVQILNHQVPKSLHSQKPQDPYMVSVNPQIECDDLIWDVYVQ